MRIRVSALMIVSASLGQIRVEPRAERTRPLGTVCFFAFNPKFDGGIINVYRSYITRRK